MSVAGAFTSQGSEPYDPTLEQLFEGFELTRVYVLLAPPSVGIAVRVLPEMVTWALVCSVPPSFVCVMVTVFPLYV
jgi:hypothetical protein